MDQNLLEAYKKYTKAYRDLHKEKIKETQKKYLIKNRDKLNAYHEVYQTKYYKSNKEKKKQQQREYYAKNKELLRNKRNLRKAQDNKK